MNSLYDLCDYGYKIKDVLKLKEYGITVRDICSGKNNSNDYKINKLYYSAQKIFIEHSNVFSRDSIYELHEYGISTAIIDSIRQKVTIQDLRNYSDKDLKEKYNIKYNTILKIRKCGYFNDILKTPETDNEKDDYNEIVKLKDYGVTQANINKMLYNDIRLDELLSWDIDVIIEKLNISKPTACKLENALNRYRTKKGIRKPLKKVLPEYLQKESKYSYVDIEKIYDEFQDYDKKELKETLEELTSTEIIKNKNTLYRYNFLQLETIIGLIKEEKIKDMLELKLQGKNFQEIGDKYGITRERVRQIVGKFISNNIIQEDIYRNIIEEYNFSKNEFMIIFETSGEVYEYLKYKYEFGEKTIEEFLENNPEYFNEEKNEKLLETNKEILYNNCKVKLNYTEIIKAYVKEMKQQKNLKEILKELNMDFEKLELQPIDERYLEARLAKIDNVICGAGRKYKYFDYMNISEEKRDWLKNMLNKLTEGYYSTLKLFKENESFFKSINIEDEYEVHNLLRKLFDGKISNATFSTMPSFFIGDIDVEPFFFGLIKQYDPIDVTEFLNIVEKKYGHKKKHVRNILKKYFDNYIILEKINIKTLEFNEKEIVLIKQKMKKELYNIESFYNILKQFYKDKYLEYINTTNLNKLRISLCWKLYIG